MTAANPLAPAGTLRPFPLRDTLPWAIFGLFLLGALYFVGAEEGATSIVKGMALHEFVHDGRHLPAFPCH